MSYLRRQCEQCGGIYHGEDMRTQEACTFCGHGLSFPVTVYTFPVEFGGRGHATPADYHDPTQATAYGRWLLEKA